LRRRCRHAAPHTRWCSKAVTAAANRFRHSVHRRLAIDPERPAAAAQRSTLDGAWITIPPRQGGGSRGGVDHDRGAEWITTRPPLKA
jgi:hypothetical protein